jgi:predicted lipid-binding transport protein (Tim44 family)
MDRPSDPAHRGEPGDAGRAFRARARRGIGFGGAVGLAIGLVAGAIAAWLLEGGSAAWMALVAFVIAGTGVGLFIGGLSRMESPGPGSEPTEMARPILDEPDLTKTEGRPEPRRSQG